MPFWSARLHIIYTTHTIFSEPTFLQKGNLHPPDLKTHITYLFHPSPSKTAKNSRIGQNAKITPSEADFRDEQPCGSYFHLHCLISEILINDCGTFSKHSLLARNSPGRPGRNILLPGLPGVRRFSRKFEILRQARQENVSAWPAWRVSSQ